jgi:hypothetical protein
VELGAASAIRLAARHRDAIVAHARRKLAGDWLDGETPEPKAFGLIGGRLAGAELEATATFPLLRNLRHDARAGAAVDATVRAFAKPSRTPLERRGWLADPAEVLAAHRRCDAERALVFASYHMHQVAWDDDPLRDTPTRVDTALGEGQGIWMLILSMVDPARPILRAFWEGRPEREVPILDG